MSAVTRAPRVQLGPTGALNAITCGVALVALADLAIRAAVRLEIRWDTFAYHIPFDALRAGIALPYELNDSVAPLYEGFPPLPHLVQGLLWRLTGSINATGVVNYLAFLAFLTYGHLALRARFWVVALIALTAPMVLIHTTVSYVDLFGNSWLAIAASSCLYLYLFPDRTSPIPMFGAGVGLVGAAWSKYQLVPVAGLLFCFLVVVTLRRARRAGLGRRHAVTLLVLTAALAAAPYGKNLVEYDNPFWPIRLPVFGDSFAYQVDKLADHSQDPPPLQGYGSAHLFVLSLFEVDHPTSYDYRPRWIIDQGNAWIAFRMGGFWGVGVIIYLTTMVGMLILYRRRTGLVATAGCLSVLILVAVLPQAHELRYYLFIPLTWAATIGMLFPILAKRLPAIAPGFLILILGLFLYMVSENATYYTVTPMDYVGAARAWGAATWWPLFQRGERYCVVDMAPIGVLLTGPTMSEFTIIDRTAESLCPSGSIVVTTAGVGSRKP